MISPSGRVSGVIDRAAATFRVRLMVAEAPRLSVTLTEMLALFTGALGVPENVPLLNDNPLGNVVGVVDHTNGPTPPDWVSGGGVYATPTSPSGSVAGLMLSAATTVSDKGSAAVPPRESVTVTVILALVTTALGVPEKTPPLNDSPPGMVAGVVVHVKLPTPPVAVRVAL